VRVPYDEGRASHIGPESCVSDREVWGEAFTGEAMGRVLSHARKPARDADAVRVAEGNTEGCAIGIASPVPRGQRPWYVASTFGTGTGRSVWGNAATRVPTAILHEFCQMLQCP
jgi:hypothetical protein